MMATGMTHTVKKRPGEPDATVMAERTHGELLRFGDMTVLRAALEPGWRWDEHVKPLAGTETCEVAHLIYAVSGRMRVNTREGEELLLEPGDFAFLAPGHDAWVEGDEPFVMLDLLGGEAIAKSMQEQRKAA